MFNDIIGDEIMIRNAFQIPKSSGTMRRNFCQLIGHSLDLEVKIGGMTLVSKPGGKWNSVAGQMLQRFVETGHPASLNRGVVKRKNNRNTIHTNAESPNVELLFQSFTLQISSVSTERYRAGVDSAVLQGLSQLRKIVESEETIVKETVQRVKPDEVSSLVDSARFWCAFGNSRQDDLHDLRLMDIPHWTARICEIASFWQFCRERQVLQNTHPGMDDGLGGVTLAGREYSRPRQREKDQQWFLV